MAHCDFHIIHLMDICALQEEPLLFRRLLDKSDGVRASWEYPFAVAGINLTYMLEEVLELRDKRVGSLILDRLPNAAPGRGFLALLAESSTAFEEVRCPCLLCFHKHTVAA